MVAVMQYDKLQERQDNMMGMMVDWLATKILKALDEAGIGEDQGGYDLDDGAHQPPLPLGSSLNPEVDQSQDFWGSEPAYVPVFETEDLR